MSETENQEVVEQEVEKTEETQQQTTPDPAIEDRARLYGWRPKDEFKGDPKEWRSADEYISRAETLLPIAKAANHKLEKEVTELRKTVVLLNEDHRKNAERQKKRHEDELKATRAEMRKAAEAGELDRYDALSTKADQLAANAPEVLPKVEAKPPSPDELPAFVEWHRSNGWYNDDLEKTEYANRIAPILLNKGYKADDPAFYAEVSREVAKKFANGQARRAAPPVEGTGGSGGARHNAKARTYANLPVDAKAACDQFARTIPGFKKEDYVANFEWDE